MSKRQWFYVPDALRRVSYLYRIDTPTASEIWFSEGGTNVLLGTYQYQHDLTTSVLLDTHIGGISKSAIAGLPSFKFPVIFTHRLSPTTETQSNTYTELTSTPLSGPTITQSTGAFAPSVGVPGRSYVDVARADTGTGFVQLVSAFYYFPAGEYQGTATGTLEASASTDFVAGVDYTVEAIAEIFVSGPVVGGGFQTAFFGRAENDFIFAAPGSQGPSTFNLVADNYTTPATILAMSHFENRNARNRAGTSAGLNASAGTQNRTEFAEHQFSSLGVRFRPTGALSKSEALRFATVEYFDGGIPKIDYFVIPNTLTPSKVTTTYPNVPAVDGDDPAPFWVTKTYQGSTRGVAFTLNSNRTPNPAFNVSASGDLISFPGYDDDLSIYGGSTVSLTKDVNGVQTPVQASGIGLVPNRILAVCDLA